MTVSLIESVCMFRYTDFETTVYSSLFGEMDVDSTQLGGTPYQDVVIRCFVHVDYRGPNDCRFRAIRVKSIEYDDAPLVNDAPWNRSCKSKLPIYDDDSDDNYDPLGLSKPKTQREEITDYQAIKNADVAGEMQQEAVERHSGAGEKDIAAYIKKEFDKKFGPTPHCVDGRDLGSYVTLETKHFVFVVFR
ncbi:hypothetical protein QR680_001388 [Steinernema hermaphroditum]|uniref:Uncharacterized protein n=1 Tax=Steinernema hermaphroditum TaxID=289476 RepID=A0AA39LFZ8_9BILA|nr:hypothetical protein QR680_001388 [Steinernema hermaphroditum]